MITRSKFRELAIAVLDDPQGTNGKAFAVLHELCDLYDSKDIIKLVQNLNGRFFIANEDDIPPI